MSKKRAERLVISLAALVALSVAFVTCSLPPAFGCEGGCTGTCASPTVSLPVVPIKAEISTTTLKSLLDQDLLTVVEVRLKTASETRKIARAKLLYLTDSQEVIRKVLPDKERMIALYSQGTPEQSAFCAYVLQTFLHSLGYTKVIFYREGFEAWTRAGNPVESAGERWPFRTL